MFFLLLDLQNKTPDKIDFIDPTLGKLTLQQLKIQHNTNKVENRNIK